MTRRASRRAFIGGGGALIGGAALSTLSNLPSAEAIGATPYRIVKRGSEQYDDLMQGTNLRWKGAAQRVAFPRDTGEVVRELREVLSRGLKPAARSGGHCYEAFVTDAQVQSIIDLSAMDQVQWDPRMKAFEVGAGAQLGLVYQLLYKQWGVYVPAGNCPTVGAGGHIAGGGYGSMNRRDGLVVDHLYAVEVVHVSKDQRVSVTRATRDSSDPHRDLWWAHTGGGGGNFGIVTRYWLRSPGAYGNDPTDALPSPPRQVWLSSVSWAWSDIDKAAFGRLMNNHGIWHERNSQPGTPGSKLFSQLKTWHCSNGSITMDTIVDADVPGSSAILNRYIDEVSKEIPRPSVLQHRKVPWMQSTQWNGFTGPDATRRFKGKSAYLRRRYSESMVDAAYEHLNDLSFRNPTALLMIASYGGAVNTVDPEATAVPQRDSIIKLQVVSIWDDASNDDANIDWTRRTYRKMFASTGGVPAPNDEYDGAFVNYADTDLDDPAWNTSALTAHDLYYKTNIDRLRRARRAYDPTGVFSHAQSIAVH